MKNLPTYEQYLVESTPTYTFDGCSLKVGDYVTSLDGFSGMIISREISNGKVQFRDNKGVIHICESKDLIFGDAINEDLQWWEVTKGILAADAIKVGAALAGGGLLLAAHLFVNWRQKVASKLQDIKNKEKYAQLRDKASKIADKFNTDSELNSMLADLQKYPYQDITFGVNGKKLEKAKAINKERNRLMRDIAKHVKTKLSPDEVEYFTEINKILRDKPLVSDDGKKLEEDVTTDPNRTVGTGTYTPSHSDSNPTVSGYSNTTDSASGGSHPVYIS
jgi:hypothetical protein